MKIREGLVEEKRFTWRRRGWEGIKELNMAQNYQGIIIKNNPRVVFFDSGPGLYLLEEAERWAYALEGDVGTASPSCPSLCFPATAG